MYKYLFFIIFIFNSFSASACTYTNYSMALHQENHTSGTPPRLSRHPVLINENHIPAPILKKIFFDPNHGIDKKQLLKCRLISKSINSIVVEGLFPKILAEQKQISLSLSNFIDATQNRVSTLNFPLITAISIDFKSWTKKELSVLKKCLTLKKFPHLVSICTTDIETDKNTDCLLSYKLRKILDKFNKKNRNYDLYAHNTYVGSFYDISSFYFDSKTLIRKDFLDFDLRKSRFYKKDGILSLLKQNITKKTSQIISFGHLFYMPDS